MSDDCQVVAGTRMGPGAPSGYPTLKTLSLTAHLQLAGVEVFGQGSRKESLVLKVQVTCTTVATQRRCCCCCCCCRCLCCIVLRQHCIEKAPVKTVLSADGGSAIAVAAASAAAAAEG